MDSSTQGEKEEGDKAVRQEEKKESSEKEDNQAVGDDDKREIEAQLVPKGVFGVQLGEHRRKDMESYSTIERWTIRTMNLRNASQELKEWINAGFPSSSELVPDSVLREPEVGFCCDGCVFCHQKGIFKDNVKNFETAQHDLEAEIQSQQKYYDEKQQREDILANEAELVIQIQRDYCDFIKTLNQWQTEMFLEAQLIERRDTLIARRDTLIARRDTLIERRDKLFHRREKFAWQLARTAIDVESLAMRVSGAHEKVDDKICRWAMWGNYTL